MDTRKARNILLAATLAVVPSFAFGQAPAPSADSGGGLVSIRPQRLSSAQLADLVAPVALYPDSLLSQVLVASTYPLEVVQAQQWLKRNEHLRGQDLMDAARRQGWDASVQGLVAFPEALALLNQDVQWTSDLGNAFLAQGTDVMAAVQRLRAQAQSRGKLVSTSQQEVTTVAQEGQTVIEIAPSDPDVVYVPQYDPTYVWGAPFWSAYPPLAYYPGYVWGPAISVGFWFGGWNWGWGWGWGPNWWGGGIYVNNNFFRHCGYNYGPHGGGGGGHGGGGHGGGSGGGPGGGGQGGRDTWQHDPGHRGGVPYSNSRVAAQFGATSQSLRGTVSSSDGWRRSGFPAGSASGTSGRLVTPGSRGTTLDPGSRTSGDAWRRSVGVTPSQSPVGRSSSPTARDQAYSPRYSSPSQGSVTPSPRSYGTSSPRSFESAPRSSAPPSQSFGSTPRSSSPSPQSFAPRGAAPSGGGRSFGGGVSPGGGGRSYGGGSSPSGGGRSGGSVGGGGGMSGGGGSRGGGGGMSGGGGGRHR